MARGRMLQNRVSKSSKLAALSSDTARLLYTWMLSHLDVNGNFYADPIMVNNIVFTRLGHPAKLIAACLDELAEKELIIRYQINGETYLNYPDFQDKQPKLNPYKEGIPEIPILTQESRLINASVTPSQVERSEVKITPPYPPTSKRAEPKEGFDVFWAKYPRKVNKVEAIQAWNKTSLPTMETLLGAIEKQKATDQWQKDGGQYIPYPSAWLNKRRWEDEVQTGGTYGIRTNRSDPGDKNLVSRTDAEVAATLAEWEAAKASPRRDAGRIARNDDEADIFGVTPTG